MCCYTAMDAQSNYVDGTWSIIVGIASFLAQGILGGYVFTAGIFYTIFLEQFPHINEVVISWMCNLPLTLWFLTGPVGSILTNKLGCRVCAVIGGLCASAGLALCFLTTNFYMVFVFYGILAGVGNGVHYVGFVTVVNRYFRKYRLMANLITSIGLTTGLAIYAVFIPPLVETFGWRGCLLILGGISFNLCALGCSLYPAEPSSKSSKRALELGLLQDKYFMLFAAQCVFCNISSSMLFLDLPALISSFGFSMTITSLALTVYGLANCFGKICHCILGYFWKPETCLTYTCSLIVCGSVMILLPVVQSKVWTILMAAILGYTYCVRGGYTPEIITNLVGLENISGGLGFGQVAKALGSIVAGPLAGLLFRWSGHYETTFYVGGSVMLGSCLVMIPVLREQRKKRQTIAYSLIYESETDNRQTNYKDDEN